MCLIIRERYGCCPDKVRTESYQKCARSQQAANILGYWACKYEDEDRISLKGDKCSDCMARNRSEERKKAIMEWLQGVDEHQEHYEGSWAVLL